MKIIKKFLLPSLAIIVFFFLLVAAIYELAYMGKIYPGVKIGPIDVGNKTPEEAEHVLASLVKQNLKALELSTPKGRKKSFSSNRQKLTLKLKKKRWPRKPIWLAGRVIF